MNLQPLPLPPDQAMQIAQMSQQQAMTSTLAEVDPQSMQGAIPATVEPLPADVLYRYFQSWESAKTAEIHEQYLARRYYHGKQWTDSEIAVLKRRRQPIVTANRIKRKVDFLVGVEQRLRRDVKAYPRRPDQDQTSWIATAGLRFVQDKTQWPRHASDATSDALVGGIGIIFQGIEAQRGKAEIVKRHVQADRFFYDPRSERWDFSDARFLGIHQWMDIDEALELLPQAQEMIEALAGSGIAGGGAGFGSIPAQLEKEKNWIDTERRRIYVIEIHYKHQGQWLYDYLCGPISLLPAEMTDRMNPYLDEDGNSCHPYMAWSPYVDERGDRYGVVRDMFSPQDEINKRRSKMLHMLSVRQTRGDKGSVKDVDEMKRELARPDGHVETNPGANFEILDQSAQIQGQAELLMEAKAEIENLGPNPALQARGVEGQSGRAILAQQNSGMTELSPVFERCREWKLAVFRKDWALVRQFWNGERWIRITGQDDAPQFLGINQIVQDPQTGMIAIRNDVTQIDVDIILEEGPDTITMQEELLDNLASLGPGAVPPQVLIQLSNIRDKEKVLKMMADATAPPPEMVEMQKRMADLESMLKAAQVDKTVADTEKTRAAAMGELAKNGLQPQHMGWLPFSYAQPTEYERMGAALDQASMQPPAGPPPPMPQGVPGQGGNPAAVAGGAPTPPNPMQMTEPRLNQAGGLPMPGQPPGVPMQ